MAARDIIQAAAGAAGATEANYIEDVFSTYLYTGTGASQTINNGIDLATKGGMVWIKARSSAENHCLFDTIRGNDKRLFSNLTSAQGTISDEISAFNSTGFTLGAGSSGFTNSSGVTHASWTFRKQPKFFDVVTYTGDGTFSQQISHSLGCTPGMIIVKSVTSSSFWAVYHNDGTTQRTLMSLNGTNASGGTSSGGMTSTYFTPGNIMDASASSPVSNGATYVAYLFAASNSGGFGAAGTDSVVACGSYTGNGTASGPTVTLGWEPQFVLVKNASAVGNWNAFDNMRGIATGGNDPYLFANTTAADATTNGDLIDLTATGFQIKGTNAQVNTNTGTYIYLAIRRGPMKTPTDATKVFAPVARTGTGSTISVTGAGFPPDAHWSSIRTSDNGYQKMFFDKLRGANRYLIPLSTDAEGTSTNLLNSFDQDGVTYGAGNNVNGSSTNYINWNFRRAPGFFDVVCYTGTGSETTVAHNLGVAPDMVIVKSRSGSGVSYTWQVWHSSISSGTSKYIVLNGSDAAYSGQSVFNNSTNLMSSTIFSVGSNASTNGSGSTYVAYLFATCPGVSKVGSYTGNGSSQTIDCGFAAGARFVLIKRTDSTGDWYVWDTARGIVSGNDPHLSLNTIAAEVTTNDTIDPASSGFIVNQVAATNVNVSSATYIYLAIA